jgi:hypothetical protein
MWSSIHFCQTLSGLGQDKLKGNIMTIAAPQTRPSLLQIVFGLFIDKPGTAATDNLRDARETADYQQSLASARADVEAQMDNQNCAHAFYDV